ncbi:unnamed protein product [Rhizoctonia solani]|uniref:Uncharacterized protein n=1 Tax=Rhizoctonia solani TaxID=456999 RepID=A0A8H3DJM3_9AGAM|nr:unnamed protein product [Rhizoctonia solani]
MKIQLRNLQVLKIFSTQRCQPTRQGSPHRLLRLLAPGSKPLQICFRGYHGPEAEAFVEFESFLARSRVARFYTQDGFPPMRLLLHHAPHLERVILDNFECYERAKIPPSWLDVGDLSSLPRLKSLDVINSILLEHQLRLMLECCPSGVTLYSSSVDCDNVKEDASITPEQLLEAFPTLKSVEDGFPSKDPTADWDILD